MALIDTRTFNTKYKTRCKTAPMQRRRTIDEFPMDHSRGETITMAIDWRNHRFMKTSTVSSVCAESERLKQYSRKMFDYVVERAKANLPASTRMITCDKLPIPAYNGPSRHGSPLYNKIPSLMSTIRLRPNSHIGRFEHNPKQYPDITQTLTKSNCDYTVTFPQPQTDIAGSITPSRSVTSEYILLPKSSSCKSTHDSFCAWFESNDGVSPSDTLSVPSKEPTRRNYSKDQMLELLSSLSSSSVSSTEPTVPVIPVVGNNDDGQELDPTSFTEASHQANMEEVINTSVSIQKKSSGNKSKKINNRKPKKPRPKCWVDDITVSSDPSTQSDIKETTNDATTNDIHEHQVCGVNDPNDLHTLPPVPVVSLLPAALLTEQNNVNVEEPIMNLEDLKEHNFELPKFICPSSEMKSRETAIKDWLANTRFGCAKRQIPLF